MRAYEKTFASRWHKWAGRIMPALSVAFLALFVAYTVAGHFGTAVIWAVDAVLFFLLGMWNLALRRENLALDAQARQRFGDSYFEVEP